MRHFTTSLAITMLTFLPCLAEDKGNKNDVWQVEDAIVDTQEKLQKSRKKQKDLQAETHKLEKELKPLQQKMVVLAGEIRKTEIKLSGLEEKLNILEKERQQKQSDLDKRQGELAANIEAMIRLSRTPPEMVVAIPTELRATLQTARALGVVNTVLRKEAESLSLQLHEIDELEKKIMTSHIELTEIKSEMNVRQGKMDKKYEKRKKLQKKMLAKDKSFRREIAALSSRYDNMKDLVEAIEKKRAAPIRTKPTLKTIPRTKPVSKRFHKKKAHNFLEHKGKIKLPVAGKISSFFGAERGKSEQHPGMTIAARPSAQVVAPFDGEVVFTGTFLDYGPMVIIRHSSVYHTLLAGMGRIDCIAGQNLLAGEPLGIMGEGKISKLYVELRKRNKPVDPAPWFARTEG